MKDAKKNTPFSLCAYGFKYHTHTHTHAHWNTHKLPQAPFRFHIPTPMNITVVLPSFVTIFVHVLMCAAELEGLLVQRETERGAIAQRVCVCVPSDIMTT